MRRAGQTESIAAAAGAVLLSLLTIALISPRFGVSWPFVIDDWWAVRTSPTAFDQLLGLGYDPAQFGDASRFRPAYTGVWNELQWHTFGAPESMTGPEAWNVLRLVTFISALTALTFTLLRGLPEPHRPAGVWLGLLANVPAAVLLSTPTVVLAFARFGPQEPLMFAGMVLGALSMLWGVRRLLAGATRSRRAAATTTASLAAGYLIWLLGVYTKEISIVAVGAAPFVYLYLNERWRREGVIKRGLWRERPFVICAVLMALPLVHVGVQATRRAGENTLYNTSLPPSGLRGWVRRFIDVADSGLASMPGLMHVEVWLYVLASLPFLIAATMVWRRRVDWGATAVLASAAGLWVLQGLSGQWDARYYIPSITLAAVAAVAGTPLSARRAAPVIAVAAALLLAFSFSDRRAETRAYANSIDQFDLALSATASLHPGSCPVYMDGMPLEFAEAWPVLMSFRPEAIEGPCDDRFEAVMITMGVDGAATIFGTQHVCDGPGWRQIGKAGVVKISGCETLLKGRADREQLKGQYVEDILRWNRIVPGVTMRENLSDEQAGPFCRADFCRAHFLALGGSAP